MRCVRAQSPVTLVVGGVDDLQRPEDRLDGVALSLGRPPADREIGPDVVQGQPTKRSLEADGQKHDVPQASVSHPAVPERAVDQMPASTSSEVRREIPETTMEVSPRSFTGPRRFPCMRPRRWKSPPPSREFASWRWWVSSPMSPCRFRTGGVVPMQGAPDGLSPERTIVSGRPFDRPTADFAVSRRTTFQSADTSATRTVSRWISSSSVDSEPSRAWRSRPRRR